MRNLLILLICLLTHHYSHAQSWTLQKGEWRAFLSYTFFSYTQALDSTGNLTAAQNGEITDQTVQLYSEYGLNNRLTVLAKLPVKMVEYSIDQNLTQDLDPDNPGFPEGGKLNYLGNAQLGAVYQLTPDEPYLNASLIAEFNTSQYNFIDGTSTGFNSSAIIPGLAYANGFGKWWTSLYAAGEFRTNDYSHAMQGQFEVGVQPKKSYYLAVNSTWRIPFGNGDYCDCSLDYSKLYHSEQEYIGVILKGGFLYRSFGLHLALSGAPYAKQVAAAPVATIGLSYSRKP